MCIRDRGKVVTMRYLEQPVEILVKRVLPLVVDYPAGEERAPAAHYAGEPPRRLEARERLGSDAAVDGHKVHAVGRVALYRLEHIVGRHLDYAPVLRLRLDGGLVYGLSLIHISEPTRLGMISYAVFCLKKN